MPICCVLSLSQTEGMSDQLPSFQRWFNSPFTPSFARLYTICRLDVGVLLLSSHLPDSPISPFVYPYLFCQPHWASLPVLVQEALPLPPSSASCPPPPPVLPSVLCPLACPSLRCAPLAPRPGLPRGWQQARRRERQCAGASSWRPSSGRGPPAPPPGPAAPHDTTSGGGAGAERGGGAQERTTSHGRAQREEPKRLGKVRGMVPDK